MNSIPSPSFDPRIDCGYILEHQLVEPKAYHPLLLSNGHWGFYSSIRGSDASLGHMGGLIDRTPEDVSRPVSLPDWNNADYFNGCAWLNSSELSANVLRNYRQILNMKGGVLETRYDWHDSNGTSSVECTSLISQAQPHLAASRFSVTPHRSGPARFRFSLGTTCKEPARLALARLSWEQLKDVLANGEATIPSGVSPDKRPAPPTEILTWMDLQLALAAEGRALRINSLTAPSRAALWYSGVADIERLHVDQERMILSLKGRARHGVSFGQALAVDVPSGLDIHGVRSWIDGECAFLEIDAHLTAGSPCSFVRHVSVSREDWDFSKDGDVERVHDARQQGWEHALGAQRAEWEQLWRADIEVDGDPDFQRVIRSEIFQLLQISTRDYFAGVGACGISSSYYGHVFWDADSWLFPVLLLLHPQRARNLVEFRFRTLTWAKANAERQGLRGAKYPWESDAVMGTEQTPHFAGVNGEREILLNGCIAIAQWQYFIATQDREWLRDRGFPVIAATADFWLSRATRGSNGEQFDILAVTSVDEKYTHVNNEAFTNAVARRNLEIATLAARELALEPDPLWQAVGTRINPPFSETENRHRVFDENVPHDRRTWMAGSLTFLSSPSLDHPMSRDVRQNNYRYALEKNNALSPEPNQMMQSMLAAHAAQLGDGDAALHWLTHGQESFLKPPFLLRSETAGNNCTHHYAAGSGFLQSVIFGFTGLRISDDGLQGRYAPVLPSTWRSLTLRGLQFRGARFDIVLSRNPSGLVTLDRQPGTDGKSATDAFSALARKSCEVLDANWRDGYTIPSARLYPFQWNWDSGFIALGLACHRPERAVAEIRSLLKGQWRSGLLPHIVFHRDDPNYFPGPDVWATDNIPDGPQGVRTSGIVQPPVLGFVVDRIASTPMGRTPLWNAFEREIFPQLVAFHRYLYEHRDPGREGLVCIRHNWEAGTDNSPPYDTVLETIDPRQTRDVTALRRDLRSISEGQRPSHDNYRRYIHLVDLFVRCGYREKAIADESPFLVQDVLFNSLLVRSNSALIAMGRRHGLDTSELQHWSARTIEAMNRKLWDERDGFYYSYDLSGERRLPIKTSSGFMPLFGGVPSQAQAARLAGHLHESFMPGRDWRLCASTAPCETSFDPIKYWRGPIWVNLNWMLHHGLNRYGFHSAASRVKSDTLRLLSEGGLFEYFDPRPGAARGLGSDNFSWSAALALDLLHNPNPL